MARLKEHYPRAALSDGLTGPVSSGMRYAPSERQWRRNRFVKCADVQFMVAHPARPCVFQLTTLGRTPVLRVATGCRSSAHVRRVIAKARLKVTLSGSIHSQTTTEVGQSELTSVNSSRSTGKSTCAKVTPTFGLAPRESPHKLGGASHAFD